MRGAIYCRKSNAQDTAEDLKSVAVQERECRDLATKNGWTVVEVFVEDGVSGALMTPEGRPELFRLLAMAESKDRSLDVIVVSHEDRIGRDTFRSSAIIVRIVEAGVRLFSVAGGERKLDSPTDELLLAITGFAGSVERHNVSRRVRAKHFDSTRRGHWTGGKVPLGYVAVKVDGHSELRIDLPASALVRRIFEMARDGYGTRAIARTLNEDPATRSLRRWSGAGIRDTLTNKIYLGTMVFGITRDVKKGGRLVRVKSTEAPVVVERPDLRIVTDELWQAVASRKAATCHLRRANGQLLGKPERSTMASHYLLSGLLECAVCHGPMVVSIARPHGVRTKAYRYYRCGVNLNKKACPNSRSLPMEAIHEAITTAIRGDVLTKDRLERVLRDLTAEDAAQPEQLAVQRRALEGDLARMAGRLEKLAVALEEGGELKALVDRLKAGEREREEMQARLEHLDGLSRAVVAAGGGRLRAQAELLVANWSEAMAGDPVVSRQVLRKIVDGHIEMVPEAAGGWSYTARVGLGRVLGGELGGEAWRVSIGSPRVSVDADGEVKTLLKRQIGALEVSRLSGSPSSPSWR